MLIEMKWHLRPRTLFTALKRRGICEVKLDDKCERNALCNGIPSSERPELSPLNQSDPVGGNTLILTLA